MGSDSNIATHIAPAMDHCHVLLHGNNEKKHQDIEVGEESSFPTPLPLKNFQLHVMSSVPSMLNYFLISPPRVARVVWWSPTYRPNWPLQYYLWCLVFTCNSQLHCGIIFNFS
jgi:hypothetical protein